MNSRTPLDSVPGRCARGYTPNRFASTLAEMQQVIAASTGATLTRLAVLARFVAQLHRGEVEIKIDEEAGTWQAASFQKMHGAVLESQIR